MTETKSPADKYREELKKNLAYMHYDLVGFTNMTYSESVKLLSQELCRVKK